MGWANCGTDSQGRAIGYAAPGRCDHPGCTNKICRGLANACGGMHGNECLGGDHDVDWTANVEPCDKYFCGDHLRQPCLEHEDGADLSAPFLCFDCSRRVELAYRNDPDWRGIWPTDAEPLPIEVAA